MLLAFMVQDFGIWILQNARRWTPAGMSQSGRYSRSIDALTGIWSLINCSKVNVRFLARLCQADQRTVLGRNLSSLLDQCGTPELKADDLTSMMIKRKCCYSRLSDTEQWKASMLKELIEIRDGQLKLENLDAEEVAIIIEHLCTKWCLKDPSWWTGFSTQTSSKINLYQKQ